MIERLSLPDYDVTLRFINDQCEAEIAELEARIAQKRADQNLLAALASKHGPIFQRQHMPIKFEDEAVL